MTAREEAEAIVEDIYSGDSGALDSHQGIKRAEYIIRRALESRDKEIADLRSRFCKFLEGEDLEITKLEKRIAALREALGFYAEHQNWSEHELEGDSAFYTVDAVICISDLSDEHGAAGKRARAALAADDEAAK